MKPEELKAGTIYKHTHVHYTLPNKQKMEPCQPSKDKQMDKM